MAYDQIQRWSLLLGVFVPRILIPRYLVYLVIGPVAIWFTCGFTSSGNSNYSGPLCIYTELDVVQKWK